MRLTRRTMLRSVVAFAATAGATKGADSPASSAGMAEDFARFVKAHPSWKTTEGIDVLRRTEYPRLAASGEAYLDYTGASLHADSQVTRHADLLRSTLLGNPHSVNRASRNATALVDSTRSAVLEYFRAPPDDYTVIFTPNARGRSRSAD